MTQPTDKFRVLQSDQQADKKYIHIYINAYYSPGAKKEKKTQRARKRSIL